jgi:hypothetical protein
VRILLVGLLLALVPGAALAQFKDEAADKGPPLGREATERIRIGLIVKATAGNVANIVATAPVPTDWPEQRVKIVNEDISTAVKSLTYRTITGGGGLKQMVIEIPQLPLGQEAKALVTFEVTRNALIAPAETADFTIPKKLDRALQIDVGPSPYIESRHPKIVAAAKEAVAERETDWQKVEGICSWIREHVVYKHCELKGAARALHDKNGDVDELAALFVGMCRAQKIPARTVFMFGHVYAEFYLEDDDGDGHWFPCEPAPGHTLGAIDDLHPILQKGDSFKNPENPKERQRFVTEYFTAAGRGGKPQVRFVSEMVAE